jgi:hypothetical protein
MISKGKMRVKSLHTWNRRDFSVGPAGWFTVLKPTGWFTASRLPGGFRYLGGQPKGTASPQAHENPVGNPTTAPPNEWTSVPEQTVQGHADGQDTTMLLHTMELSRQDHRFMRPVLVVLGATAITSILLWWIAFSRFH